MLSTNSSSWSEIGRGQALHQLGEREASRGAAGEDHMVTGVWPATMVAAARFGARWPWLREGEREREEV